ncbi:flavodoxin family protein [Desulfitobacterium chlororespirans]|uniref:Multimeric flavodoxin WrbA n=1 Tax=Desulfitobacterium chlororespirans DSM 11544 TaxID=1121395 RepID=A0A1M7UNL5_9FIRM|nr:flavodoxin family protein [Desulfitobacterium chlororespirans]SHN84487.1 Multimeric flavodoxin WrbA [Desulfitobacterium chlororespirans DSM 11544]
MKPHILGIAGSPRRNGNTDRLLKAAMNALAETGYSTEIINIRDLQYSPCLGCNACSKTGRCVQKDDIQYLQERLVAADRIIVAAPVFFMGINAQTKAVIDRMQTFWALKYVFKQPVITDSERLPRYGLFLSTAGTQFPDVFACAERAVKNLYHVLDIKYYGSCTYKGIDQSGDIEQHPSALQEVREKALILAQL